MLDRTRVEIGITEDQQTALITLLGMLERGEIGYYNLNPKNLPNQSDDETLKYINMRFWHCGSVGCIAGWCEALAGVPVWGPKPIELDTPLGRLVYPPIEERHWIKLGVDQIAHAIRTFLMTGEPEWIV